MSVRTRTMSDTYLFRDEYPTVKYHDDEQCPEYKIYPESSDNSCRRENEMRQKVSVRDNEAISNDGSDVSQISLGAKIRLVALRQRQDGTFKAKTSTAEATLPTENVDDALYEDELKIRAFERQHSDLLSGGACKDDTQLEELNCGNLAAFDNRSLQSERETHRAMKAKKVSWTTQEVTASPNANFQFKNEDWKHLLERNNELLSKLSGTDLPFLVGEKKYSGGVSAEKESFCPTSSDDTLTSVDSETEGSSSTKTHVKKSKELYESSLKFSTNDKYFLSSDKPVRPLTPATPDCVLEDISEETSHADLDSLPSDSKPVFKEANCTSEPLSAAANIESNFSPLTSSFTHVSNSQELNSREIEYGANSNNVTSRNNTKSKNYFLRQKTPFQEDPLEMKAFTYISEKELKCVETNEGTSEDGIYKPENRKDVKRVINEHPNISSLESVSLNSTDASSNYSKNDIKTVESYSPIKFRNNASCPPKENNISSTSADQQTCNQDRDSQRENLDGTNGSLTYCSDKLENILKTPSRSDFLSQKEAIEKLVQQKAQKRKELLEGAQKTTSETQTSLSELEAVGGNNKIEEKRPPSANSELQDIENKFTDKTKPNCTEEDEIVTWSVTDGIKKLLKLAAEIRLKADVQTEGK